VDYVGAGAFPLRFERTYDSRYAFRTFFGGDDRELVVPLGVGWFGSYFQTVRDLSDTSRKSAEVIRPDGRRLY
jgi:hypothetical protein